MNNELIELLDKLHKAHEGTNRAYSNLLLSTCDAIREIRKHLHNLADDLNQLEMLLREAIKEDDKD